MRHVWQPSELALLAAIRATVRANTRDFKEGAELLKAEYSLAATRRREANRLRSLRNATGPDGSRIYPRGHRIYSPRMPYVFSPRGRLENAVEHFRSRDREDPGWHATMRSEEAKAFLLLAWLMYDDHAHEAEGIDLEFQRLPWDAWSKVDGHEWQGRELASESQLDPGLVEMLRSAFIKAGYAPPRPTSFHTDEILSEVRRIGELVRPIGAVPTALAPDSSLKHSSTRGGEVKDKPAEPGSGQDDAEQVPSAPRTLGEARDHLMTRQGFVAAIGLGGFSWASNKELKPLLGEPADKVGNTSWYTVVCLFETVKAAAPKGFWEGRAKPSTLPVDSAIRKKLRPPLGASKRSLQE